VVARGRALGATWQADEIDRLVLPRSALIDRMAGLLGGRAAEELVFGEPGSGAADDLRRVGEIARRMVCELGMGEGLSPLDYPDGAAFHGRSEELDRAIEAEVGRLVDEAHAKALAVLTASREALESGAQALLERETLSAAELDAIAGPPLPLPVALAVVREAGR
ncbi:MAG: ATP-dependent zinc metalloprotease FtsH, partial [Acidimicrobiales bacterium]